MGGDGGDHRDCVEAVGFEHLVEVEGLPDGRVTGAR